MNDTLQILGSIMAIQEASDVAYENVHEKINDFAEKVSVMEQYGLNVMSENPTIQHIIENHDEVITEYKNDGPKKINKKIIGWVNWILPEFKKIQKGIEEGTVNHHQVDNFGSSPLKVLFFGFGTMAEDRTKSTMTGFARMNLPTLKNVIKQAKKTGEFNDEEIRALSKCSDTLDNWLHVSKLDRNDRSFYDRFIAYNRDTRTMDKIKKATDEVVDALEELKTLATKHYNGGDTE